MSLREEGIIRWSTIVFSPNWGLLAKVIDQSISKFNNLSGLYERRRGKSRIFLGGLFGGEMKRIIMNLGLGEEPDTRGHTIMAKACRRKGTPYSGISQMLLSGRTVLFFRNDPLSARIQTQDPVSKLL
jgi:hypothetical protein